MINGAAKGSDFERTIAKALSLWWTCGAMSDVFWRSSQSGGRATERAKKGLSTYGSYGDLTALNPIGTQLMTVWAIELKRGNSAGSLGSLWDKPAGKGVDPWIASVGQATKSARDSGALSWALINRRDRKRTMLTCEYLLAKELDILMTPDYDASTRDGRLFREIDNWSATFPELIAIGSSEHLKVWSCDFHEFLRVVNPAYFFDIDDNLNSKHRKIEWTNQINQSNLPHSAKK